MRGKLNNTMSKGTTTTRFKTSRPVTDSELLMAMKNAMHPIFEHFEEELAKGDGNVLQIEVSAKDGSISLKYGVGAMLEDENNQPPALP
jgi:hypothetical protein